MEKDYTQVYLTNLPSFYKIKLYNEIAKNKRILVIYTMDSANIRNQDFFSERPFYDFIQVPKDKSGVQKAFFVLRKLMRIQYSELIIGGWDSLTMWLALLYSSRKKNSVVVESSILESRINGFKGVLKRLFLTKISKAYVSGHLQKKILDELNFRGQKIITKGVGLYNRRSDVLYTPKTKVQKFIYVGRLSPEKNVLNLIQVFKELPHLQLTIVGFGPLESKCRELAGSNIDIVGAVNNKDLYKYYQLNDVFILPSISEPWGLVVEEALNNGLPVLVSDRVGCLEEVVVPYENGLEFSAYSNDSMKEKILEISSNLELYNRLRRKVCNTDFEEIEKYQIKCYL